MFARASRSTSRSMDGGVGRHPASLAQPFRSDQHRAGKKTRTPAAARPAARADLAHDVASEAAASGPEERAAALGDGPERLVRRGGLQELVVVPRPLGVL